MALGEMEIEESLVRKDFVAMLPDADVSVVRGIVSLPFVRRGKDGRWTGRAARRREVALEGRRRWFDGWRW